MKVYIWGTGKVAKNFVDKAKWKNSSEWGGYVVSKLGNEEEKDVKCYTEIQFDENSVVVIASSYTNDILKTIIFNTSLTTEQCIALRPTEFSNELNVNMKNLWKIIENPYAFLNEEEKEISVMRTGFDYRRDCLWDSLPKPNGLSWLYDYVRINTFDLVANEIKKEGIKGAVAELGVYRGDFAQYINMKFNDRKCYLFDTFSGFDENESKNEVEANHADEEFAGSFKDTSVDYVLNKMPFPDLCIVKKGLFPQSLEGLEEEFAFVSLDVDYENSVYEGLKYFYPRIVKGGCIFLHDYNDIFLDGVKNAVVKYENEYGRMTKIPIADGAGTLIIVK